MPDMYALMDVFALPSYREGFPRAPMEASAMGAPCVVTNVRGCREAVEHERNGLIVPLRDVDALAEALIRLLRDHDRRRAMGDAGRRMAYEQFDERLVFSTGSCCIPPAPERKRRPGVGACGDRQGIAGCIAVI
jgi:glycosyltransferase involved in cell wall biosynthesis